MISEKDRQSKRCLYNLRKRCRTKKKKSDAEAFVRSSRILHQLLTVCCCGCVPCGEFCFPLWAYTPITPPHYQITARRAIYRLIFFFFLHSSFAVYVFLDGKSSFLHCPLSIWGRLTGNWLAGSTVAWAAARFPSCVAICCRCYVSVV